MTKHMRGEKIMPSTQNAVNNHEYRSVPITALAESATNPRKRFDEKSLEELAASFKTQGILAPLLVRELGESKYEVVAGARRLRAAKLADLERLPVRVVKLTDAEAIEAQCVENLQREDIHPLEEALGFKSLLELGEPAYSIAIIASRAGKSEAYVYGLCSGEHNPCYVVVSFMWRPRLFAVRSAVVRIEASQHN
jgi:ParB family chromosome partitioning protein